MRRVLVASRSCRSSHPKEELKKIFADAGFDACLADVSNAQADGNGFDCIVVGTETIGSEELEAFPGLSLICKFGVGIDNIDAAAATDRGVAVRNLPAVNSDAVAELALGLMLAVSRRIVEGDRKVRSGNWPRLVGTSLKGKTLGILGTGSVGCSLTQLAEGIGMTVIGNDVKENDGFLGAGGSYCSFEELIRASDVISVHTPLTSQTHHLISSEELEAMRPSSILINCARGGIVDDEALAKALERGEIAGAGLDVLESAPAGSSSLLALDNVICTPHIAANEGQTLDRMLRACIDVLASYYEGKDSE